MTPTTSLAVAGFSATAKPGGSRRGRRFWSLLGPGYVVAVGYIDPGNWATDLAAGARHGFALLAVVLAASLAAAFLQALSVRLALATGKDLARLIRERFPRPVVHVLWLIAELAMVATDLAELLGSAVALKLLFGMPLIAGVLVSAALTFLLLSLPARRGVAGGAASGRIVAALAGIVTLCFVAELWFARPDMQAVLAGFGPRTDVLSDPEMLYLSLGILGATIMPHNLYLHAALARDRFAAAGAGECIGRREAAAVLTLDSSMALALAFLVNAAILVLAGAAFHGTAAAGAVAGIEDAYRLLDPMLGTGLAGLLFAAALLAAGQSSAATGTMAGQIVTEGFLDLRLSPRLRALVTRGAALVPALGFLAAAGGDGGGIDRLLVLSQVVLGLSLPFVLVPMLLLLGDCRLMGGLALRQGALRGAWGLVLLVTVLNGWLMTASLG